MVERRNISPQFFHPPTDKFLSLISVYFRKISKHCFKYKTIYKIGFVNVSALCLWHELLTHFICATKSLFSCRKVFGLNYSVLLHINPAQWKKQSFPACLNRASGPFQYHLIPNVRVTNINKTAVFQHWEEKCTLCNVKNCKNVSFTKDKQLIVWCFIHFK